MGIKGERKPRVRGGSPEEKEEESKSGTSCANLFIDQ